MMNKIEIIINYTIISVIVFILLLLILLFLSEKFRKYSFALIYSCKYFGNWTPLFYPHRKVFLKRFTELKAKNPNEKLLILEVGPGPGCNFDFYPDNCQVIALDYNEEFKNVFVDNISKHSNIEFMKYINGVIEDMALIDDNSVDVVITTHVFCSVKDQIKAFREVKRVLKKGGKYFFMEHVGFKTIHTLSDIVWSLIQNIINPIWRLIMCGCELQRKTWINLERAGFESVDINVSYPDDIPRIVKPQMWGFAQK